MSEPPMIQIACAYSRAMAAQPAGISLSRTAGA